MLPLFFSPQALYRTRPADHAGRSNIIETPKGFVVELEAAGFTEESINLSFENNVLNISGKVEINVPEGFEQLKSRAFSRRFRFSSGLNEEGISAKLNNGLLVVELPKKSPRQISLNAS